MEYNGQARAGLPDPPPGVYDPRAGVLDPQTIIHGPIAAGLGAAPAPSAGLLPQQHYLDHQAAQLVPPNYLKYSSMDVGTALMKRAWYTVAIRM